MNKRYRAALEAVQLSDADKARISSAVLAKLERKDRRKKVLFRTLVPVFSAAALCLIATPFIIALMPANAPFDPPPYALHEEWRMGEYFLTFESAAREGETLVLSAEGTLSSFSFADASAVLGGESLALNEEASAAASDVTSGELTFYYELSSSQWENFEDEDIALTLWLGGEAVQFTVSYDDLGR